MDSNEDDEYLSDPKNLMLLVVGMVWQRLSGNDARNGENPHEYRLFCPSILLLILD